MALENEDPRIATGTGNGVITELDFAFKILDESEISLYIETAADSDEYELQTITTDYTVEFDADAEEGTVTVLVAVPNGYNWVVLGATPQTQGASFPRVQQIPAKTVELGLDKLTLIAKDLQEQLDRTPKYPIVPPNPDPISIDPPVTGRALKYLDNSDGTWTIVPSDNDPDTSLGFGSAYQTGLYSARPTSPAVPMFYYSTDHDSLDMWIPEAARWFTIG